MFTIFAVLKNNRMPHMNGTGPDGKASATGRGMGKCIKNTDEEALHKLGKGIGLRRKRGGGTGKGKRLRNDQQ